MLLQASSDMAPCEAWSGRCAAGRFPVHRWRWPARAALLFWNVRTDLPSAASGASPPLVWRHLASSWPDASVAMSVFAGPLQRYTDAAAAQLLDRKAYADAVLGEQGGAGARTARPYTGDGGGQAMKPTWIPCPIRCCRSCWRWAG
jgi:hypothetical protein